MTGTTVANNQERGPIGNERHTEHWDRCLRHDVSWAGPRFQRVDHHRAARLGVQSRVRTIR